MNLYRVEVSVTFNYGGHYLWFVKKFELPFIPFYGLWLSHDTDEFEHDVSLENNDYCSTIITYNVVKQEFEVHVRNSWKRPVSDETIDEEISSFAAAGWKRKDKENIPALKKLMLQEYKKRNPS